MVGGDTASIFSAVVCYLYYRLSCKRKLVWLAYFLEAFISTLKNLSGRVIL